MKPLPQAEPVRILLLVDGSEQKNLASVLQASFGADIEAAANLQQGLELLQRGHFQLLLVEDAIALTDSAGLDVLWEACNGTLTLELNFATTNQARIVRQVRSALARHAQHKQQARLAATRHLRDELSGSVAGLLLQSQLLLAQPGVPLAISLQQIVTLAESLSRLLRVDPEIEDPNSGFMAG